eukprot:6181091-Pleurochrysis_carterae.AAC.1
MEERRSRSGKKDSRSESGKEVGMGTWRGKGRGCRWRESAGERADGPHASARTTARTSARTSMRPKSWSEGVFVWIWERESQRAERRNPWHEARPGGSNSECLYALLIPG